MLNGNWLLLRMRVVDVCWLGAFGVWLCVRVDSCGHGLFVHGGVCGIWSVQVVAMAKSFSGCLGVCLRRVIGEG